MSQYRLSVLAILPIDQKILGKFKKKKKKKRNITSSNFASQKSRKIDF